MPSVLRPTLGLLLLAALPVAAQSSTDSVIREQPRGFAVGIIDTTDPGLNTAPTLAHALQARLPGVSVSQGQGFFGASSRVWLRGPSGLVVNEPLLIIDGARTHGSRAGRGFIDRDMPSRLEDLDMETVERIEVLRGPAAAALYGPGTSKGVILVTTKRGRPGPTRWDLFAESGPSYEVTEFPANYGTLGLSTTGVPVDECPLARQAAGTCTPVSRHSWNPLENASPFRTGWSNAAGGSATGGTQLVQYRVGASHDRADGVYETNESRATSVSGDLSAAPTSGIDIRLTAGHRIDNRRQPRNSPILAGMFGESVDDPVRRGYNMNYEELVSAARDEDVRRTTGALNATWRARPWLRTSAVVGYDRLDVRSNFSGREEVGFPLPTGTVQRISRSRDLPQARTARIDATGSYLFRGLDFRSTVGIQYVRDDDHGRTFEATFVDDPGSGASSESVMYLRRTSKGAYVQQQVAWHDRLLVTGSLRGDRSTDMGVELENVVSHAIDVSWAAVGFGSRARSWLDVLRLRAAYGKGGDQPVATAPANFPGSPPDPSVSFTAAERGSEVETGLDAFMFSGRMRADLTYYRRMTKRGLAFITSFGGPELTNSSNVRTSGFESSIDGSLLTTGAFAWDMGVAFTSHRSEIERFAGPAQIGGMQLFANGEAVGAYATFPYTFTDSNGDGLIATSEITVGNARRSLGSPFPSRELALRTKMTFGGRVHLSAILDHRGGAKLLDAAAEVRCRTLCAEQNDPETPLAAQSRIPARLAGTSIAFIEDADYTKLREVRLALELGSRVARFAGASGATLSVTGRNLYTWTPFSGLDPEVVSNRYDTIVASAGFYQPPLRSFTARLDLHW